MKIYKTKKQKLKGGRYSDLVKSARKIFCMLQGNIKRRPYIRSAFFKKDKVFLDVFWSHLSQKNPRDRMRRLKYYDCSIDLIKNTKFKPVSKINRNKRSEILHRFAGVLKNDELFFVQVKENKKTKEKHFMSCFADE